MNKSLIKIAPFNATEEELLVQGYITKEEYAEMASAKESVTEAINNLKERGILWTQK